MLLKMLSQLTFMKTILSGMNQSSFLVALFTLNKTYGH